MSLNGFRPSAVAKSRTTIGGLRWMILTSPWTVTTGADVLLLGIGEVLPELAVGTGGKGRGALATAGTGGGAVGAFATGAGVGGAAGGRETGATGAGETGGGIAAAGGREIGGGV